MCTSCGVNVCGCVCTYLTHVGVHVVVHHVSVNMRVCAWPAIVDMNYLNSVIRVVKLLYMESMGNFYQLRTV